MILHQTLNLTSKLALIKFSFCASLSTLSQPDRFAICSALKGFHP